MKEFIESYYSSVYSAISRLTGSSRRHELEALTETVLIHLWERQEMFLAERRKGIFIYRIILYHVFSWLKESGGEERIAFLRKILYIHSDLYDQLPIIQQPTKQAPGDQLSNKQSTGDQLSNDQPSGNQPGN